MGSRRSSAIFGLALLDLGVFVAAVALLPLRGSWQGESLRGFINCRDRWGIAWGLFTAAVVASIGAYHLLESREAFGKKEPPVASPEEVRLQRYLDGREEKKVAHPNEADRSDPGAAL